MLLQRWRATAWWLLGVVLLASCSRGPQPGTVLDEARQAGRDGASFKHSADDYFHDMDGGVKLDPAEIAGRNMWLVWSGGNDRFWDGLSAYDLRRLRPAQGGELAPVARLQPGIALELLRARQRAVLRERDQGPDPNRRGLWLDVRSKGCAPDPFEDESKYPGVAIGSRGKPLGDGTTQPVGSYYGYASGIVGLRLFPNPAFDEKAAKAWDPERYYTDPSYYNRKDLVRPYRVGMSCGFCHVGPSPVNPPADPAHPTYANLSSSVGAQYMWVDRLFIFNSNKPEGQQELHVPARPHVPSGQRWTRRWSRPTASTTRGR